MLTSDLLRTAISDLIDPSYFSSLPSMFKVGYHDLLTSLAHSYALCVASESEGSAEAKDK